jgi:amino-acid N-acetyltransferase
MQIGVANAPRSALLSGAMDYTLRPALTADLPAVRKLLADAGLPGEDVAPHFGDGYAVAVASDGAIIGATGVEVHGVVGDARYGLLRSAVVADAWRGRGVGEALARDRLAWARAQGLAEVYLLTTTAAGWFPRFGFALVTRESAPAPLQRSSEFASTCPSSAVTMRLRLAR